MHAESQMSQISIRQVVWRIIILNNAPLS